MEVLLPRMFKQEICRNWDLFQYPQAGLLLCKPLLMLQTLPRMEYQQHLHQPFNNLALAEHTSKGET